MTLNFLKLYGLAPPSVRLVTRRKMVSTSGIGTMCLCSCDSTMEPLTCPPNTLYVRLNLLLSLHSFTHFRRSTKKIIKSWTWNLRSSQNLNLDTRLWNRRLVVQKEVFGFWVWVLTALTWVCVWSFMSAPVWFSCFSSSSSKSNLRGGNTDNPTSRSDPNWTGPDCSVQESTGLICTKSGLVEPDCWSLDKNKANGAGGTKLQFSYHLGGLESRPLLIRVQHSLSLVQVLSDQLRFGPGLNLILN